MRRITMVKKIGPDGSACRKCADVLRRLEAGGHLEQIDRVAIADERDPDSAGWALARRHGVTSAPFFVVFEGGAERVYTNYFQFAREVLQRPVRERDELAELLERNPELDFI